LLRYLAKFERSSDSADRALCQFKEVEVEHLAIELKLNKLYELSELQ